MLRTDLQSITKHHKDNYYIPWYLTRFADKVYGTEVDKSGEPNLDPPTPITLTFDNCRQFTKDTWTLGWGQMQEFRMRMNEVPEL